MATSVTFRAIGPATGRFENGRPPGPRATRPGLGRMPTMEQKLAGLRSEPPVSEPCASHAVPDASAAADPPEDPATLRSWFHGFSVVPSTSLKVFPPAPNSGVFAFA